mmetsp:Transcript_6175/g.5564  ORF Transcript_6175/g.5564 Transcript_6175/m.5564 type:complete len:90 (+) Transcript_6175:1786-2055(+)
MSAGDDKTVRIWKIPPPLTNKKMRMMAQEEPETGQEEEYCILNIETRHDEPINSVVYLQESIATGSRDGIVKVYDLEMRLIKVDKEKLK